MHEQSDSRQTTQEYAIYLGKEIVGHGYPSGVGNRFFVRKGSRARVQETDSIPPGVKRRREELLGQESLVQEGDYYRLTRDEEFSSPSNAAGVLLGRSVDGTQAWQPHSCDQQSANCREVDTTSTVSKASRPSADHRTVQSELPNEPSEVKSNAADATSHGGADELTETVEIKQGGEVVARGMVKPLREGAGAWSGPEHKGPIVVLAGSTFRDKEVDSLTTPYSKLRDSLFSDRELVDDSVVEGRRALKKNYKFNSLSAAASAILGAQTNGRNAWTLSEVRKSDRTSAEAESSDSRNPLSGIALHLGILDGTTIADRIRKSAVASKGKRQNINRSGSTWVAGHFPVPYVGNSRVANRSKDAVGTVDRASAMPPEASKLLSLEIQVDAEGNGGDELKSLETPAICNRFHLDLRQSPQKFDASLPEDSVVVVGVEAVLEVNSRMPRSKPDDPLSSFKPMVLVFHLELGGGSSDGQLAQQFGLWLYGEESDDFKGYVNKFVENATKGAGNNSEYEGIGDDVLSFVTISVSPEVAGVPSLEDYQELLKLASLNKPATQHGNDVEKDSLPSDRLAVWHSGSSAVFRRSAMVVTHPSDSSDSDEAATTAMEVSSIYCDVIALIMLEQLTLNKFMKASQDISSMLLNGASRGNDNSLRQAEYLEGLQRDYMANSASYGKLHIVMRSNGGDIYRALRTRWHLESLRSDISEEITRLSEHVGTLAERSREELEKKSADELRTREWAISLSLAIAAIIIGAPALSDFAWNLAGWPRLWTFVGTCVVSVILILSMPSIVRLSKKLLGFRKEGGADIK